MIKESDLLQALDTHLFTMVDAPPIDFENVGLDQNNQIYLSQNLLPAEDINLGIESTGSIIFAGIYQVMVNVPKGTGRAIYTAEIDKIRERFIKSQFSANQIDVKIHKVWRNSAIVDENYFRVPISIRYRAT